MPSGKSLYVCYVPSVMRPIVPILLSLCALNAGAATLDVRVRGPVRDAIVYAVPEGRQLPLARRTAVMDQKNRMFIPHILAVQTGTSVRFPNSDDIRHHVYSFSPAKAFQLPLYKGTTANPITFDRAGVVTLGCNIHDQMSAFIVVVDTPYFENASADGHATLRDVQAGRYTVHLWYPDMREEPAPRSVTLSADEVASVSFDATRHGRP
jgi:plastocyanin